VGRLSTSEKYHICRQIDETTIDRIQNYYESFCRSSSDRESLEFSKPDIEDLVRQEKESLEINEVNVIDFNEADENNVEAAQVLTDDPYIRVLESLNENPMDLPTRTWPPTTTHYDAMLAVQQLPSKSKQKFVLPGRASLGFSMEESNPTPEHPDINTNLDKPFGKFKLFNSCGNSNIKPFE
jgi:mannose/fructose/N-acetylgalactosamine-specific phosphotransferase system component IIB